MSRDTAGNDTTGMPRCPNCGCYYMGMHSCGGTFPLVPTLVCTTDALEAMTALAKVRAQRIEALEFALRRILLTNKDAVIERICREALNPPEDS